MALKIAPLETSPTPPNAQQTLAEEEFMSLWQRLKNEVPEGVLQLQYEMTQIEKETKDPSAWKTQALFDKLIAVISPFFDEAGIPLKTLPTSEECIRLQQSLQQKWEEDALLKIWTKGKLRDHLKWMNMLTGQGPQTLDEIRRWIKNHPENINRISRLDLEKIELKVCPPEIALFREVTFLDLSSNQLRHFDLDLTGLTRLELLHIEGNALSHFSSDLSHCQKLNNLSLATNRLTTFSANLTHAPYLHHFNLSNNQLKSLAVDLSNCKQLSRIELGCNRLKSCELTLFNSLYSFDLSNNLLTSFSCDLRPCTYLHSLSIENNQIASFDSDISRCQLLINFNYSGNPNSYQWFKGMGKKPWIHLCCAAGGEPTDGGD